MAHTKAVEKSSEHEMTHTKPIEKSSERERPSQKPIEKSSEHEMAQPESRLKNQVNVKSPDKAD